MSQTAAPSIFDTLNTFESIHLAPAMTTLRQMSLAPHVDQAATELLVAIVQADGHYHLGQLEGHGLGFVFALQRCAVLDEYQCAELEQLFIDTADAMRPQVRP